MFHSDQEPAPDIYGELLLIFLYYLVKVDPMTLLLSVSFNTSSLIPELFPASPLKILPFKL